MTDFFGRTAKLGGPIVFAHIDGAHTYEQSMRDFRNIDRHLVSGGFIVFDDSADNSDWGSRLSAQEASKLPQYELIAKNPNYCIRKIAI
jgi:cephalosporin hydroxylase